MNSKMQPFFNTIGEDTKELLGLAYGLGVDSTAIIVGLVKRGIRPDYILFADVGFEKESTYAFLPVIQKYFKKNNFPPVTVVRYGPKTAPYRTIEGNMVMNMPHCPVQRLIWAHVHTNLK